MPDATTRGPWDDVPPALARLTPSQRKAYDRLLAAGVFFHDSEEQLIRDEPDEQEREEWRFVVHLGDWCSWGTADDERADPSELPDVWNMFSRYGWNGIYYWVMKKREWEWHQISFRDVQRAMQFIQHEEALREAAGSSVSAYAYGHAEYHIASQEKRQWERPKKF